MNLIFVMRCFGFRAFVLKSWSQSCDKEGEGVAETPDNAIDCIDKTKIAGLSLNHCVSRLQGIWHELSVPSQ